MIQKQASIQGRLPALAAILGLWLVAISGTAYAALEDDIRARLQPAGEVCVMGEDCAQGLALASNSGEPMEPAEIYQTYCFACHGTGANNAPVMGEAADWEDRLAKGMDELYQNAINGYNEGLMPAKGLCMSCSDEDVMATVDFMLEDLQ